MEKREVLNSIGNSTFLEENMMMMLASDTTATTTTTSAGSLALGSIFDMVPCESEKGLMDLLGGAGISQDFGPSLFDLLQGPPILQPHQHHHLQEQQQKVTPIVSSSLPSPAVSAVPESPEVLNNGPFTPNSSSISSSSNEAANDIVANREGEEEELMMQDHQKTKKQ